MRYFVTVEGEAVTIEVERRADGSYRVRSDDGRELDASLLQREPELLSILLGEQVLEVQPEANEVRFRQERYVARAETELERATMRATGAAGARAGTVRAAMPGRIVRVLCEPGSAVAAGAPLLVIEAMKMQNELCASAAGVVQAVRVRMGDTVERGAVLIELTPA